VRQKKFKKILRKQTGTNAGIYLENPWQKAHPFL
jgi:hypothetical protein